MKKMLIMVGLLTTFVYGAELKFRYNDKVLLKKRDTTAIFYKCSNSGVVTGHKESHSVKDGKVSTMNLYTVSVKCDDGINIKLTTKESNMIHNLEL